LEEDTSKAQLDSTAPKQIKYVDHFGPFTVVAMYYMRNMAYSQLFQALTERNIKKTSKGCQFNTQTLAYTARFRLCHISQSTDKRDSNRQVMGYEKTKIVKFFKDNFDQVISEERDSLENCFDRGEILYIIGFDGKGENHHVIAAILYATCAKGTYINWFAVTQKTYDSSRFGKHANNQPFRNMGLGSFMLQVVQLQAVAQGYKSDLYLQANMGTLAASYYQHHGFILTATNKSYRVARNSFEMVSTGQEGQVQYSFCVLCKR